MRPCKNTNYELKRQPLCLVTFPQSHLLHLLHLLRRRVAPQLPHQPAGDPRQPRPVGGLLPHQGHPAHVHLAQRGHLRGGPALLPVLRPHHHQRLPEQRDLQPHRPEVRTRQAHFLFSFFSFSKVSRMNDNMNLCATASNNFAKKVDVVPTVPQFKDFYCLFSGQYPLQKCYWRDSCLNFCRATTVTFLGLKQEKDKRKQDTFHFTCSK